MIEPPSELPPVLSALIPEQAQDLARRYKIAPEHAAELLREWWPKDRRLVQAAAGARAAQDLTRTAAYKSAVKQARKQIYYRLRQYKDESLDLERAARELTELSSAESGHAFEELLERALAAHVSTRERRETAREFSAVVTAQTGVPQSILDVGCGLHPVQFTRAQAPRTPELYAALERDRAAVAFLEAYRTARQAGFLQPLLWDLEAGWAPVTERFGRRQFDLAFMMKLIPVIRRRSPDLLGILADVPARTIVITASRTAMTRRRDISRREARSIEQFLEEFRLAPEQVREIGEETVWIVRKT